MPQNTPRGYTYPVYGDTQNFPAQMQDYALDVDADVQLLEDRVVDAFNRPTCRISGSGNVLITANTNNTVTFSGTHYDNNAMANLGANAITLNEAGIYLLSARVTFVTNGNATLYGTMVTFVSSAGVIAVPARKSVRATQNFDTTVTLTTLHHVTAPANDNITVQARHNSAASVNYSFRTFQATKVSGLAGGF